MTPPVTIPHTHLHPLRSEHVDADFELWIAEPRRLWAGTPVGPRGALYVTDANLFFGTAVEMTRIMNQLFGELPPLLVVGIAYPTDDPRISAELRNRDFTPSEERGFEEIAGAMQPDREPVLPEGERMGGADAFLDFLVKEVRPLVEERHDVAPGRSVLFGSSLGGLFTVYALLSRPRAFDHYIAVSPALWWDDEVLFDLGAELSDGADDVSARVFLGVGGLEEDDRLPFLARFKAVTNVRAMGERLRSRGYPSLTVEQR
ncbi:MAG: hypothetical protein GWM92_06625, partial [Gemmatimonadetes bacterium]|nr:alpha/beta hydrolase [Gemmatimonadota bacterium]NIR78291.1 alpha/beta hydrolase [Gemmatimonadota bacterium]NIT86877.1 alpha/beta hydrolase [Gemmatimonadota bacterium]NIU31223.1 alpha/beta hydrolase [Gemmatimonadota bacterium]NIU35533.1 hypothetical protein [Gemmatimonadota bacterium]